MYDHGGIYWDLDFVIEEWDEKMHYIFDYLSFTTETYDHNFACTWGFAAKPGHPIPALYLKMFKENYLAEVKDKPVNLINCFNYLASTTMFDTGPFFLAMLYYKNHEANTGLNDIAMPDPTPV